MLTWDIIFDKNMTNVQNYVNLLVHNKMIDFKIHIFNVANSSRP